MSTTFKLDDDGDIIINELNNIEMTDPERTLEQRLEVYLETYLGNDIFYPERGVPWVQYDNITDYLSFLENIISNSLKRNEYVERVVNVSATRISEEEVEMDIQCVANQEEISLLLTREV